MTFTKIRFKQLYIEGASPIIFHHIYTDLLN
jgi:hypothetical protein